MELFCDFFYIYSKIGKPDSFLRLSSLFLLHSYTPVHRSQNNQTNSQNVFESDVKKTQENKDREPYPVRSHIGWYEKTPEIGGNFVENNPPMGLVTQNEIH